MNTEEMTRDFQEKSQEAAQAIAQWRQAHPKATLAEIEAAVDAQMNQVRAQMIEPLAQASPLEQEASPASKPGCPQCAERMQARGKHRRVLPTQGGQTITLQREYESCPHGGYSCFPPR